MKPILVMKHPKGGWQVRRFNAARASARTKRREDAVAIAKRLAARDHLKVQVMEYNE